MKPRARWRTCTNDRCTPSTKTIQTATSESGRAARAAAPPRSAPPPLERTLTNERAHTNARAHESNERVRTPSRPHHTVVIDDASIDEVPARASPASASRDSSRAPTLSTIARRRHVGCLDGTRVRAAPRATTTTRSAASENDSRRFIARERGESRERDARGTTKAVGTTSPTWIALTLERLERETRARRRREA